MSTISKLLAHARNAMTPASAALQEILEAEPSAPVDAEAREVLTEALQELHRASKLIAEAMGWDAVNDRAFDHVRAAIAAHEKARDTPDLFEVLQELCKARDLIQWVDAGAQTYKMRHFAENYGADPAKLRELAKKARRDG